MEHLLNQVLEGDCLDVMRGFDSESIGMILTSPPYNVGLQYEGFVDQVEHAEHVRFTESWLREAFRVLKDTGRLYAVISEDMLFWIRAIAEPLGYTYVQKLVWCKPNLAGGSKMSQDWNYLTEDIILFRKGKRTPMLRGNMGVTTHNWIKATSPQTNHTKKETKIHPAQMPVSLCIKIIARTPGEPVLDPFAGSGSVLVASKTLGRPYIGIELVSSVASKARERLRLTPKPLLIEPEQPLQAELLNWNGAEQK